MSHETSVKVAGSVVSGNGAGIDARLSGDGTITQETRASAANANASDRRRCNGATMQWIILEALVALALGLAIVWWTLSPARRRERDSEQQDVANPHGHNDVRGDDRKGDGE